MVQSPVQQQTPTVTTVLAGVISQRVDRAFGLMGNGNVALISALTSQGFPFTGVRHEVAAITGSGRVFSSYRQDGRGHCDLRSRLYQYGHRVSRVQAGSDPHGCGGR